VRAGSGLSSLAVPRLNNSEQQTYIWLHSVGAGP